MDELEQLRTFLAGVPAGGYEGNEQLEGLLARAWHLLQGGGDEDMAGYKIIDRPEGLRWEPPHLRFEIERHGAMVAGGSSRAEI